MLIYIAIKNWVCRTLVRDPFIEEAVLWPIQPIYSQKLPLIASMNIGAGNIMIYIRVSTESFKTPEIRTWKQVCEMHQNK